MYCPDQSQQLSTWFPLATSYELLFFLLTNRLLPFFNTTEQIIHNNFVIISINKMPTDKEIKTPWDHPAIDHDPETYLGSLELNQEGNIDQTGIQLGDNLYTDYRLVRIFNKPKGSKSPPTYFPGLTEHLNKIVAITFLFQDGDGPNSRYGVVTYPTQPSPDIETQHEITIQPFIQLARFKQILTSLTSFFHNRST